MTRDLPSQRVWVIRAGKRSKAHDLFIEGNVVALERQNVGNLTELPSVKKAFTDQLKSLAIQGGGWRCISWSHSSSILRFYSRDTRR